MECVTCPGVNDCTSTSKIPFPALADAISFAVLSFPKHESLPAALTAGPDNYDGMVIRPADHPLGRPSQRSPQWRDIWRTIVEVVADFKVRAREGVDVGEDARQERDFPQEAPFLIGGLLRLQRRRPAAPGQHPWVRQVEDVQG